jgi:hypothetical protein
VFDAVHLETVPADSHIASPLECALRAMCFHVWSSNDELTIREVENDREVEADKHSDIMSMSETVRIVKAEIHVQYCRVRDSSRQMLSHSHWTYIQLHCEHTQHLL